MEQESGGKREELVEASCLPPPPSTRRMDPERCEPEEFLFLSAAGMEQGGRGERQLPAHDFAISLPVLDVDLKAPAVGAVGSVRAWLAVKGTLLGPHVFAGREERKKKEVTK